MSGRDKSCCGTPGPEPGRTTSPARRASPTPPAEPGSRSGFRFVAAGRDGALVAARRRIARHVWSDCGGLVLAAAAAERIVVQLGPRSWYTASTPVVVLAALLGGPLLGVAAGLSTQILRPESVWRRHAAEGGLAASRASRPGSSARSLHDRRRPPTCGGRSRDGGRGRPEQRRPRS